MRTFLLIAAILTACQLEARMIDSHSLKKKIIIQIEKTDDAIKKLHDPSDVSTFYWLVGIRQGLEEALILIECEP